MIPEQVTEENYLMMSGISLELQEIPHREEFGCLLSSMKASIVVPSISALAPAIVYVTCLRVLELWAELQMKRMTSI